MLVHGRGLHHGSISERKWFWCCIRGFELVFPLPFKINGIYQVHHSIGRNLVDDCRDQLIGFVAHPAIDGIYC